MTRTYHEGYMINLSMMIAGIVLSRNAKLSALSADIPGHAKDKSIEMRLRRWVKNDRLGTAYTPV